MKRYLCLALALLVMLPLLMFAEASTINIGWDMAGFIGGATAAIVGLILLVFLFYFFFIRTQKC